MKSLKMTVLLTLLVLLAYPNTVIGQNTLQLSNESTVSLITCGSGAETYSLFGHTAIRIKDPANAIDEVYNYGTFDFSTPNFYLKFVKGDLKYLETSAPYLDFMQEYLYESRSVYEQVLNLSNPQKQELFRALNAALHSEDRFYIYKFIDKNCTTMVVNVLNKSLGGEVLVKTGDRTKTYRAILNPYFNGDFYEQLGISIIFGAKVDRPGEQIFLPTELQAAVKTAQYKGQPLCLENRTLLEFPAVVVPFSWWNNFYAFSLIFLALILANKKAVYRLFFVLLAAFGLFLSFAGLYSLHHELQYNYNILLFNPLLLALVYCDIRNYKRGVYWTSRIALASIGIYLLIMINKVHLLMVLPLIVASILGLLQTATGQEGSLLNLFRKLFRKGETLK